MHGKVGKRSVYRREKLLRFKIKTTWGLEACLLERGIGHKKHTKKGR